MFNKENNQTIQLAIDAVKKNIPCDNELCKHKWYYYNDNWNPYIMIDKHRPSKLAIQNASHKPILCWFHIMKTFSKNLSKWKIPAELR